MTGGPVLVTGANGFLGQHVCQALLRRGYAVRGAIRSGRPKDLAEVDYRDVPPLSDKADWRPHLEGCRAVVHTAARVHTPATGDPEERQRYLLENADASEDLAQQAIEMGLTRMVFISSIGAATAERKAAKDATAYQESKLLAERKLQRLYKGTGFEVVSLRPTMIYGPAAPGAFRRLERALSAGLPLPFAAIANRRSFLYVGHLTSAVAACLTQADIGGKVFAMSDGVTLSTPAFVRLMAQAMGRPDRLWPFPPALLKWGLATLGKDQLAEALLTDLIVDNGPIQAALDWAPHCSTAEGLAQCFPAPRAR